MIKGFLSYSHVDDNYRNELQKHLMSLQHQAIIETWHDRRIVACEEWAGRIDDELNHADIILLLVSSDFIASSYCYDLEMKQALIRHERGESFVIPVILRSCHWTGLPFGKLQAATKDGKPVEKYPSVDDAFLEVTQSIELVAKRLLNKTNQYNAVASIAVNSGNMGARQPQLFREELPRSSNLTIPKIFTDHDRDEFVTEAFNYIARFFEGSLNEVKVRNPEVKFIFERVDARSFEAAIYFNGNQVSKCGIWLGEGFASRGSLSISYSNSGLGQRNSLNESMRVKDSGNLLGLEPFGLSYLQQTEKKPLTNQGAAEYYWAMFFEPIQRNR